MGFTIKDALNLTELKKVRVLAGVDGLDREILAVSVMEVPDISSYVEKGELLLTTTYPISNNSKALEQLVPMLASKGLAGLAIKPERYIDRIPPIMIKQANDLKFPLLCLPKDASFGKILNTIMSVILHQQASLLKYSESVHRSLTDLVLSGSGPERVIQTLFGLIHFPIVLCDPYMEILVTSDQYQTTDQIKKLLLSFKENLGNTQASPSIRFRISGCEDLKSILFFPIKAGKDLFGYICILENVQELPPTGIIAVEQATVALAIQFQKQRAVKEQERRFLNDFVRDLVEGRILSLAEMRERGKVYKWAAKFPQVMLIMEVIPVPEMPATDLLSKKIEIQQHVENAIHMDKSAAPGSWLIAHLGDMTVIFYSPESSDPDVVKQHAYELAHRILDKLKTASLKEQYKIQISISRLYSDLSGLSEGYRQARETLQINKQLGLTKPVVHYDDLGVYRLLVRIDDLDEIKRFCEERLGKLLAYDRRHGTELMTTLNAIIAANGNLNLAARQLFIHYNTLRYRVKKIEALTGIHLDSWHSMSETIVALKAYQILQICKRD